MNTIKWTCAFHEILKAQRFFAFSFANENGSVLLEIDKKLENFSVH